jgi:hypothetical protein
VFVKHIPFELQWFHFLLDYFLMFIITPLCAIENILSDVVSFWFDRSVELKVLLLRFNYGLKSVVGSTKCFNFLHGHRWVSFRNIKWSTFISSFCSFREVICNIWKIALNAQIGSLSYIDRSIIHTHLRLSPRTFLISLRKKIVSEVCTHFRCIPEGFPRPYHKVNFLLFLVTVIYIKHNFLHWKNPFAQYTGSSWIYHNIIGIESFDLRISIDIDLLFVGEFILSDRFQEMHEMRLFHDLLCHFPVLFLSEQTHDRFANFFDDWVVRICLEN